MGHPLIYMTADAVVSSLGFSTEECLENLTRYTSGVQRVDDRELYVDPFLGAKIPSEELQLLVEKNGLPEFSRLEQLFILSIKKTLEQSQVDVSASDCGLIVSTTKGNISLLSAENETDEALFLSALAEKLGAYFGFSARPIVVCNACISGVSALIVAKRMIEAGKFKHVIVAGGDELSRFVVSGFHAFKSVSGAICKPYDAARDGLSLGEACGSVLLTTEKAQVAENEPIFLLGGDVTNDANHISGPSRTGEELAMAMKNALRQANLAPADVSVVNMHGTATAYNDEMESKALHLAELGAAPMQSLKSYVGHTLGASGVIETIFCKKQLETNQAFGIFNFEIQGTPYPLNISADHRHMELKYCLKTASGFGGCNAAIVIGKEPVQKTNIAHKNIDIQEISRCKIDASGVFLNNQNVLEKNSADDFATFIRKAYSELKLDYRKFYKMDDLSKLGFIAAEYLVRACSDFAEINPSRKGIVTANRSASLNTDINYRRNIDAVGDYEASPAIFVYTLPNVMLGELCIRWKIKGENTFFIQREPDVDFLTDYARIAMTEQGLKYCIVGWCDLLDEDFQADFWLVCENK